MSVSSVNPYHTTNTGRRSDSTAPLYKKVLVVLAIAVATLSGGGAAKVPSACLEEPFGRILDLGSEGKCVTGFRKKCYLEEKGEIIQPLDCSYYEKVVPQRAIPNLFNRDSHTLPYRGKLELTNPFRKEKRANPFDCLRDSSDSYYYEKMRDMFVKNRIMLSTGVGSCSFNPSLIKEYTNEDPPVDGAPFPEGVIANLDPASKPMGIKRCYDIGKDLLVPCSLYVEGDPHLKDWFENPAIPGLIEEYPVGKKERKDEPKESTNSSLFSNLLGYLRLR